MLAGQQINIFAIFVKCR